MAVSPAERWNWFLGLWAIALLSVAIAFISREDNAQNVRRRSVWRFAVMLPAALLLLFGATRHIHLAFLMGGILLPYTMAACLFDGRVALLLLPGFTTLALFCPSVGIILSTIFHLDGFLLKSIIAVLMTAILPCVALLHIPHLNTEAIAFSGLALLVAGAYAVQGRTSSRQPPLRPVFDNLISEHFRGVQDNVSDGDRQFFGDSEIKRFTFIDQADNAIYVLCVGKIDNIHQIHPTTYCLRVNGYEILKEHVLHIQQEGGFQPMDVQELVVERNGAKRIVWQWYGSKEYSTASFLRFRTFYSPANDWSVYILDCPVATDMDKTQQTLKSFIREFLP